MNSDKNSLSNRITKRIFYLNYSSHDKIYFSKVIRVFGMILSNKNERQIFKYDLVHKICEFFGICIIQVLKNNES